MIFSQYNLIYESGVVANSPLIGWHNIAIAASITADTETDDDPASNLANPATDLRWTAEDATAQHITVELNYAGELDYLGVAGHNFGSEEIAAVVEGAIERDPYTKVLLHMNGVDAATTFTDSNSGGSAHTWTAAGTGQIDTAFSKFGGGSGIFAGTGYVSTPDHADFTLGQNDFTIEAWFKCDTTAAGTDLLMAGQLDAAGTVASMSFLLERTSSNIMRARIGQGAVATLVTGTTQFTTVLNTGWNHIALVRTKTILKLFINGIQEGGNVSFVGAVNDSASALTVGRGGEFAAVPWNGWVDEFRYSVGVARWTTNFIPPSQAYDQWNWGELGRTNDSSEMILLHFDGPDGSVVFQDHASGSQGREWFYASAAQIDRANSRFGNGSLLLDGTDDIVYTGRYTDLVMGDGDWTVDCWFYTNDAGVLRRLAGWGDGATAALTAFMISKTSGNLIELRVFVGSTTYLITGFTQFSNVTNVGWHHVAAVRDGATLRLFVDGIQEGTTAIAGTVNTPPFGYAWSIGAAGSLATSRWLGWIDEFRYCLGEAKWVETFAVPARPYGHGPLVHEVDPFETIRLNFDGVDGSVGIVDTNTGGYERPWVNAGNARLDSAQKKFGPTSGEFDGVGDYWSMTSDVGIKFSDKDWTIDFWFFISTTAVGPLALLGQMDAVPTAASRSIYVERSDAATAGNRIRAVIYDGVADHLVTGTLPYTDIVNPGWHHCAIVRFGDELMIFLDGRLEDTDPITRPVNPSTNDFRVGAFGEFAPAPWAGWIDDFRFRLGDALWTEDFDPPTRGRNVPPDNAPLIFRWTPRNDLAAVRLKMSASVTGVAPTAAVIFVGKLLALQRNIYVGHTPINYGRIADATNNESESGAFLGRIVRGEKKQSGFTLANMTASWYRVNMDPFIEAAVSGQTFFWSWRPGSYPEETAYSWMTGNAQPSNQRSNGMMQISLSMGGITE